MTGDDAKQQPAQVTEASGPSGGLQPLTDMRQSAVAEASEHAPPAGRPIEEVEETSRCTAAEEYEASEGERRQLRREAAVFRLKKRRLKSILKDHHCWWFRVLGIQQAWEFIIPFPLPEIVRFFLRRLSKKYDEKNLPRWAGVHSSLWMTLTIILSAYSYYGSMRFESARLLSVYAADASKTLFTAAFLLGTILSVSVALPGQAVIKSQIDRDPDFVFDFMAPFMWALMWGIIGGLGLSLVYYFTPLARNIAYVVGIYGACMELNALVHTIRMYMIGIILYYYEERNKNTDSAA